MFKTAYELGARVALVHAGVVKVADDTEGAQMHDAIADNPAESLAEVFQGAEDESAGVIAPDNKTRVHKGENSESAITWGPEVSGSGADGLEQMVPDFVMPRITSV